VMIDVASRTPITFVVGWPEQLTVAISAQHELPSDHSSRSIRR
jgi:hypothetical protein